MNFLRFYLCFENPEMLIEFEKEIVTLTERSITMGIEAFLLDQAKKEGIEEGVEKNQKENRVKKKESGIDVNQIANITGLSVEAIEKLA